MKTLKTFFSVLYEQTIGAVIRLIRNTRRKTVNMENTVTFQRVTIYTLAILATVVFPGTGISAFFYILVFHDVLGMLGTSFQISANA